MANLPLTIACGDYDRTRAIQDGRVPVVGCDVTYLALPPEEIMSRAVMGEDFWPYGIEGNAKCVETMARCTHEQGLTDRQVTIEELFAKQTFEIAKV